jgi:hypothetical protein
VALMPKTQSSGFWRDTSEASESRYIVKSFAAFAFFVRIGIALFNVLDFIDDDKIDLVIGDNLTRKISLK